MSVRWLAESFDHGSVAARVGRDGDRLVAEWMHRACLSVNIDGSDAQFEPNPKAEPRDVEKIRRGALRLLLAHLHGAIPLHASAVAIAGRAIVFVGGSELGKSTLAAAMCDQAGASLLGDDAVIIERRADSFHVIALEESHWLDAASARALGRPHDFGDKAALPPRGISVEGAQLAVIVHLAFTEAGGQARVLPVVGLAAIAGLLAQLTRFIVDDPVVARRDLAALADLVERTRIVRLERPRRLDLLAQTAREVVAFVTGETS